MGTRRQLQPRLQLVLACMLGQTQHVVLKLGERAGFPACLNQSRTLRPPPDRAEEKRKPNPHETKGTTGRRLRPDHTRVVSPSEGRFFEVQVDLLETHMRGSKNWKGHAGMILRG